MNTSVSVQSPPHQSAKPQETASTLDASVLSVPTVILSVVGARPNFMKVAPLDRAFRRYAPQIQHRIVHTGQHYDSAMSDAFFHDLDMPEPAYFLNAGGGTHAEQTAKMIVEFEKVCRQAAQEGTPPALVIVVGDVNSTIACTLTATKLGIPVAHIEAGLRSFDRTMPEELNRLATDALCDYAFVTEQSGTDHLLREGWSKDRIFFVGNTMIDSLHYALPKARQSSILDELGVEAGKYALVTLHRPSNVDEASQLRALLELLVEAAETHALQIVFPVHPRTRKNIETFGLQHLIADTERVKLLTPQGYINFLALMNHARIVITDSGGVQEETTALGIPCLTLRTTTERPVTCELGTNMLLEPTPMQVKIGLEKALSRPAKPHKTPPLWDGKAAERAAEIIVHQCLKK